MIVIAPLFGIAQTVYFIGVAEWVMGVDKEWGFYIEYSIIGPSIF
jgi:hypothetical protein